MSSNDREKAAKLSSYEREAMLAYKDVLALLDIVASYFVSPPASVTLYTEPTQTGFVSAVADGLNAGVGYFMPSYHTAREIKSRLKDLRKYSGVFRAQFIYLTPENLDDFGCFGSVDILSSPKLVASLNSTLKAMKDLLQTIQKKKSEFYKMAASTPVWTMAWSNFYSTNPAVLRLLDRTTTEGSSVADFNAEQKEIADKVSLVLAQTAQIQVSPSVAKSVTKWTDGASNLSMGGPLDALEVTGVVLGATLSVATQVGNWNIRLFSKQYPKGIPYCDATRNNLTTQSLKNSKDQSSSTAQGLDKASARNTDTASKFYGASFVKTPEFTAITNAIDVNIATLSAYGPTSTVKNKYASIVASIKNSQTKDGVMAYVTALNALSVSLTTSIAQLSGPNHQISG